MNEKPSKVVEAAISQLGSPYVFGAWGEFCTPSKRKSRVRSDHPTIKSKCQVLNGERDTCRGCQWDGDRMFDCRGFTHWCLAQVGIIISGQGATSQYNTADNWIEKGEIEDMPECVCCVFVANGNVKEHTGLYVGGGDTVECSAGVQRKKLAKKWTHYAIPKGLYTAEEIAAIRGEEPRPKHIVRYGDRGEDVKDVQALLNNVWGYDCGNVDGIFGKKTLAAVKAFQQDNGLTPDGIVGLNTWAVLTSGKQVQLYTVTIEHLKKSQADAIQNQFPTALVTLEGVE